MKAWTVMSLCLAGVVLLTLSPGLSAADFPKWPVKNGDFSGYQGWGRPANWSPATESGKHGFKMDPPPSDMVNPPSAAVIETAQAGRAYYWQAVHLMKGDYRLTGEVSGTGGGKVEISSVAGGATASSGPIAVAEKYSPVRIEFSAPNGSAAVYLRVDSPTGGSVSFRNVSIEALRLDSSPVPLAEGQPIGAVVVAEDATPAERYACYELQRIVFRMTGLVVPLTGRDKTFAGRRIFLGRAAPGAERQRLEGLPEDSYIVRSRGNEIFLFGNSDQGTLYAVYDFLKQQGCRWVVPGDTGEVIPQRSSLALCKDKVESPDYMIRGFMTMGQDFFPGGGAEHGWIYIDAEEYFDWSVRNRLNAIWYGGGKTYDLGQHRGHGWVQMSNHSYNSLIAPHKKYFREHPEWYPLVKGKRMPVCDLGPLLPNQLCVSNGALRDYTVELVLGFFAANPQLRAFPLNPMDGPNYWCECIPCKKLDPPGLDWSKHAKGDMSGMTDRALNYANEVARRVARTYPDRFIEMAAYGNTRMPPKREKVHKNVLVKYANVNGPLGKSMMDPAAGWWKGWQEHLAGWSKAGPTALALYNYFDWEHPDATLFWFFSTGDMLKSMHRRFGCRGLLGETTSHSKTSPMLYAVLAETLWNVDADYNQVVRDACDAFYGPAADDLYAFNMRMHDALLASTAWKNEGWHPNSHLDLPLKTLELGRETLERAADKVKDDPALARRVAVARFGHAYLTYVRALKEEKKTPKTKNMARRAFDTANALRTQHAIMVKLPSVRQLKDFYYPPVVDVTGKVLQMPLTWNFREDRLDVGIKDRWFAGDVDSSWGQIRTNESWTSQGHSYHGVAWYHVGFSLPPGIEKGTPLALYFVAVDGYVDVFLDGVKIGEQKVDVGVMWDKPFSVPLPADFDPTGAHNLMVRVRKDTFAAGIWKPVMITRRQ